MGVPVGAGTDATRVASYNPFSRSTGSSLARRSAAYRLPGGESLRPRRRRCGFTRGQQLVLERGGKKGHSSSRANWRISPFCPQDYFSVAGRRIKGSSRSSPWWAARSSMPLPSSKLCAAAAAGQPGLVARQRICVCTQGLPTERSAPTPPLAPMCGVSRLEGRPGICRSSGIRCVCAWLCLFCVLISIILYFFVVCVVCSRAGRSLRTVSRQESRTAYCRAAGIARNGDRGTGRTWLHTTKLDVSQAASVSLSGEIHERAHFRERRPTPWLRWISLLVHPPRSQSGKRLSR